jgi:hypothetical protein
MSIFLMFGKYSSEAMQDISPDRTERAREVIQKVLLEMDISPRDLFQPKNWPSNVLLS